MSDAAPASTAKAELRTSIRSARHARVSKNDDTDIDDDARIADRVLALPAVRSALAHGQPIACYAARREEPPTADLRDRLLRAGAVLQFPQIADDDLRWVDVTSETTWTINRWGIEEPEGSPGPHAPGVWIIPALAIDTDGYRLGQGGGYYDRALAKHRDRTCVIGIVFDDELIDRVPREEHDTAVDVVVTPQRTLRISTPESS